MSVRARTPWNRRSRNLGAGVTAEAGAYGGGSVKLVALRTWGDPWVAEAKRTYVGPEATLRFVLIRLTAGYLRSGSDDVFTVGIGLGN